MKKTTKALTLIVIVVVFVALMIIGLKGWNNLVVPNINKLNDKEDNLLKKLRKELRIIFLKVLIL